MGMPDLPIMVKMWCVPQFQSLFQQNLSSGKPFDTLVDEL